MRSRARLHKNKLNDFIPWLINRGWVEQDGKGCYEVLRMVKDDSVLIVHEKLDAKEHYTTWGYSNSELDIWIKERRDNESKESKANS